MRPRYASGSEDVTTLIPFDEFNAYELELSQATTTTSPRPRSGHPSVDLPSRDLPTRNEITQDILIAESDFDDEIPAILSRPRPPRTGSKHRLQAPPSGLRGRAAMVAIAAGAAVAAGAGLGHSQHSSPSPKTAAVDPQTGDVANAAPSDTSNYLAGLPVGERFADERQAAEDAGKLPMYVSPVAQGQYKFTSLYGFRPEAHWGMDMAAPIGTPIHAAQDGIVEEAGAAEGFGDWIVIKSLDGTTQTVYGHMYDNGVLVHKGQQVTAGQVIGLVGSNGQSSGAHCHFEVWIHGVKTDPTAWLTQHGVQVNPYIGG